MTKIKPFKVPCPDCIGYAMCINKDEINCSILKKFYLEKSIDPKMRKYKSPYIHKLESITKSLGGKTVINWGFNGNELWIDLIPKGAEW